MWPFPRPAPLTVDELRHALDAAESKLAKARTQRNQAIAELAQMRQQRDEAVRRSRDLRGLLDERHPLPRPAAPVPELCATGCKAGTVRGSCVIAALRTRLDTLTTLERTAP